MILFIFIFYLLVIFAVSGVIFLKANKEIGFYDHLFNWWISPFILIAGLVFIDKSYKKQYFRKVKSNLLIKK
jgi:hypothetical protein